jgi:hypothetical protein
MDIGIWMAKNTLKHKLEAQNEKNPEQAWNLHRWPKGMSDEEENRLFVATEGYWRGYFILSTEALYTPGVTSPYTILFDTRTWTRIPTAPVKRFRGFTYKVPEDTQETKDQPGPPSPEKPVQPSHT